MFELKDLGQQLGNVTPASGSDCPLRAVKLRGTLVQRSARVDALIRQPVQKKIPIDAMQSERRLRRLASAGYRHESRVYERMKDLVEAQARNVGLEQEIDGDLRYWPPKNGQRLG